MLTDKLSCQRVERYKHRDRIECPDNGAQFN